jgi:NADH-quinone oxidoreductase subunit A
LFDVEISVLFPWSILLSSISWYGFWLMLCFLIFLTVGFIYEWRLGVISWNIYLKKI